MLLWRGINFKTNMTIHNMVYHIYLFLAVISFVYRDLYIASPLIFKLGPKLFSAILGIFQVGSPILPMAASDYNPLTDASNTGRIIYKNYCVELLTVMRFQ
jgi:hypothetical protein